MDQRQASKANWSANGVSVEEINSGSLQRIADAAEKMAVNYVELQNSRDRYKRWYEEEQAQRRVDARRIIALRGVITRLKRRARAGV